MNRSIEPTYSQPNNLELQTPQEIKLENGISLFILKDVKDDSVKLDIEWAAGSKYQAKKLVANFTNKLLLSGNKNKSAASIADELDYYGGFFRTELDRDHAGLTLYGLRQNIEKIFTIFSDAFMSCTFPDNEFEKERMVALSSHRIESEKIKNICRRRFTQAIFGEESEYGQIAIEQDYKNINKEDLVEFHKNFYLNTKPVIFVVGNVNDSFIEMLRKWSLKMTGIKPSFKPAALIQEKGRIDLPNEKAIQSAIRFGRLMVNKKHKDYLKLQVLNTLFGGYFGSRLMTNIREDKGYTYGIGSGISVMENASFFFITTEVRADVKEDTIKEIFKELTLLKTELISDEELLKVKNYMLGDFLRHADGPIAMMENFKNIYFNNLALTFYDDFIHAVKNTSAIELQELTIKYFDEKDLTIVTAG